MIYGALHLPPLCQQWEHCDAWTARIWPSCESTPGNYCSSKVVSRGIQPHRENAIDEAMIKFNWRSTCTLTIFSLQFLCWTIFWKMSCMLAAPSAKTEGVFLRPLWKPHWVSGLQIYIRTLASSKRQTDKTCGTSSKHGSNHGVGQLYQSHPYSCCTVGCWVSKWHSQHGHPWFDSSHLSISSFPLSSTDTSSGFFWTVALWMLLFRWNTFSRALDTSSDSKCSSHSGLIWLRDWLGTINPGSAMLSHQHFMMQHTTSLAHLRQRKGETSAEQLIAIKSATGRCCYCWNVKGRRHDSCVRCRRCGKALCITNWDSPTEGPSCFERYHTERL